MIGLTKIKKWIEDGVGMCFYVFARCYNIHHIDPKYKNSKFFKKYFYWAFKYEWYDRAGGIAFIWFGTNILTLLLIPLYLFFGIDFSTKIFGIRLIAYYIVPIGLYGAIVYGTKERFFELDKKYGHDGKHRKRGWIIAIYTIVTFALYGLALYVLYHKIIK